MLCCHNNLSNNVKRTCGYLHNDVVDGDVDELHEEPNESHDGKPNSSGHGNFLELCKVKRIGKN